MWNLKYDISDCETENRNRPTDRENRPLAAKGHVSGGGMEWDSGISRCKLFCIEWINSKVLGYSTGNSIQYPVISYTGKEKNKMSHTDGQ